MLYLAMGSWPNNGTRYRFQLVQQALDLAKKWVCWSRSSPGTAAPVGVSYSAVNDYQETVFWKHQGSQWCVKFIAVETVCASPGQAQYRQNYSVERKDRHEVPPLPS